MSNSEPFGNPYKEVLLALNGTQCPYLVIGGVAVVQHGSSRFTPDVNLALDFGAEQVTCALHTLQAMGLCGPKEFPIETMAKPEERERAREEYGALLPLGDLGLPNFSADLLLEPLSNFSELFAQRVPLAAFGTVVPMLSLKDLLQMKNDLNRPQDQMDVEQLEFIAKVATFPDPDIAYDALQSELPLGVDRGYYDSLMEFQKLSPDERFDWLLKMLSAVGGFCVF